MGAFKNNVIYIFHPEVFAKESSHKSEEFWITLKHEYCHYYYSQITGSHFPYWLNEGLASYLSGKKLLVNKEAEDRLFDIFEYFNKSAKGVYWIGQYWVEFLINKYGRENLIELIKSLKSGFDQDEFAENFKKTYKIDFSRESLSKIIK